jgi:hypothetical protein
MFAEATVEEREEIRQWACKVIQESDNPEDREMAIRIIQLVDTLEPGSRFEAWVVKTLLQLKRTDRAAHRWQQTGIWIGIAATVIVGVLVVLL